VSKVKGCPRKNKDQITCEIVICRWGVVWEVVVEEKKEREKNEITQEHPRSRPPSL
jgi:hypothetical protein